MKSILLMIALLVLVACTPAEIKEYEITQDDIFLLMQSEDLNSTQIAVKGVKLGMSESNVLSLIPSPDNFTLFQGEGMTITNLEYGGSLGLEGVGLIIHLENDVVTTITLKEEFNSMLVGDTRLGKSDADIYYAIGVPDEKNLLFKYEVMMYNDYGVDIITFRGDEVALSLRQPRVTNRNLTRVYEEVFKVPLAGEIVIK